MNLVEKSRIKILSQKKNILFNDKYMYRYFKKIK